MAVIEPRATESVIILSHICLVVATSKPTMAISASATCSDTDLCESHEVRATAAAKRGSRGLRRLAGFIVCGVERQRMCYLA